MHSPALGWQTLWRRGQGRCAECKAAPGRRREFDGARPCRLSLELRRPIADQAYELALVLQHLGYVGRCSLDAILAGTDASQAHLYWIECNGRWGGVSIPLSLNRRLEAEDSVTTPFVIFEQAHLQLAPCALQPVLSLLQPWLQEIPS